MRRAAIGIVGILASCGTPAAPPRAPERDLDPPPVHPDAAVIAVDATGSAAQVNAPGVDEALRTLAALATDLRAALDSIHPDPAAPDFDPRCHELDRTLDALRPRVIAATPAARLAPAGTANLPIVAVGAALEGCRVRYQMQLPGMEGLIDDLQDLAGVR